MAEAGVKIDGAVCVSRDLAGNTAVDQTDHLARKGAKTLGGVRLMVSLFAPPLLATIAVGAGLGGVLGRVAHSKVKSKIEEQACAGGGRCRPRRRGYAR